MLNCGSLCVTEEVTEIDDCVFKEKCNLIDILSKAVILNL